MSRSSRRDTLKVDSVELDADTDQYVAVLRDGSIAGEFADAFGVTMSSGDAGDYVPVCRLGFCPIIVTTAGDNNSAKTELIVGANGEFQAIPSSTEGGATAYVAASSEESTGTDGEQTGAWIDCLSTGRDRTIEAPA